MYSEPPGKNSNALRFLPFTQTCGDVVLRLFMEVTVQLSLDSSNVQHEKLALRLFRPNIQGFSVEPTPATAPAAAPMEDTEGTYVDYFEVWR